MAILAAGRDIGQLKRSAGTGHGSRNRQLPPLGRSCIRRVERRLGLSLPADLKAFYLAHNGGHLHPSVFVKGDDAFEVQIVLPMQSNDPDIGFEETYEDLVLNTPGFPDNFIPFAAEAGGDYFVYNTGFRDKGTIFFNQSEYYEDPSRFLIALAPSLNDFLNGLVDDS